MTGEPNGFGLPRWAVQLAEERAAEFTLVSAQIDDACALDERAFRQATHCAYERIARELERRNAAEPVRVWNFIPGILEPLGALPQRYMAFNEGRWDAYLERYGSVEEMERRAPTASGVGHPGPSLIIHCLACSRAGQSIENPRQLRASRYSDRYGRRPPCFARATRIDAEADRWLLVGGTASVVGEETVHLGDLEGQLAETVRNLESLTQAASVDDGDFERARSIRVYYPRPEDEAFLRRTVPDLLASDEVELFRTELCRPELLLEIEGLYHRVRN